MSTQPAAENLTIEEALRRAGAHWNAGQADQAELFCRRVLAAWPGQSDAMHLLGIMAHAYGNLDAAIDYVRQSCQAPRAPAVYFSDLGELCRQKGLLSEAEQAGRRAIALDPSLVPAWNNLGIILQEAGKLEESFDCLDKVVTVQPENAEARNNLGNTCKRLGRLEQAEVHYTKALSLNPNYAEVHSNLANLQTDLGKLDQAAESARRAIAINPQLADAYINLAGVEKARLRNREALQSLEALLAFAPLHATALSARAAILKDMDRPAEALDSARRAVGTMPGNADAQNSLGMALQANDKFDEAMAAYDRAASLPGIAAENALVNRANLLMEVGRDDEAMAAYRRAIEVYPRSAQAWFNYANLKTFADGDPNIVRMEALLVAGDAKSFSDRMALHFALGKAYLESGDGDRAFRHLSEGNQMKRSTVTFDGKATHAWMASIAATFTKDLSQKFQNAGVPSDLPVFVVGIPRSGTTLIEQILASHPMIQGAGELSTLQRLVDQIADYPSAVRNLSADQVTQLGNAYLDAVTPLSRGRRHVVDKLPANFLHAGLIHLMLPGARIIHCRRDPADTCLSCYSKLFTAEQVFTYDLGELGHFHRDYQTLMGHWRAILPPDRFLDVDYEAVVADVEKEARRMIAFLGLPWHDACLKFHENKRIVRTASVNQVRQPIYASSLKRWERHARHLGPLLEALGIAAP